ncbi:FCD domain-containing protein [Shimia sp. NS0008-38b]|uniref:FCD domain-containing protein n=1 Tax=Shimia sp. NS0008-38b TaxID=3127653 RepID=UPI00310C0A0E
MPSTEKKQRASDLVADQLAARIQSGDLVDGQPLPSERSLIEEFGISRTVVREAVLALSNRGLVEARPRYRPVVRKPGIDAAFTAVESIVEHLLHEPGGVKNLFDTRIIIEAALVRQAAESADKDDIVALRTALAINKEAIHNSEEFYQTDIAFHNVIYQISNNPVLPAIHKAYTSWLAPQWSQMPRLPDRNQANFEAHQAIFDAILARDADAAEAALRNHLNAAWEQVVKTFVGI